MNALLVCNSNYSFLPPPHTLYPRNRRGVTQYANCFQTSLKGFRQRGVSHSAVKAWRAIILRQFVRSLSIPEWICMCSIQLRHTHKCINKFGERDRVTRVLQHRFAPLTRRRVRRLLRRGCFKMQITCKTAAKADGSCLNYCGQGAVQDKSSSI